MQKKLKTLGFALLAFSLMTAVGLSVNTETASAAKKVTAKTLKLNKKKLSIYAGAKKTLKATVKPKKATVTWKTNKKKVATVTKKGVVKGIKKGTAKITVTSGKKKATCKVTVKQPYSIKSVAVVNSKVVRVTLNKAKKLTAKSFAVTKKATSDAKTSKTLTVGSIVNSKNTVYDLILSTNYDSDEDDNDIENGNYVTVKIKALTGVNTKETIYYSSPVATNEYIGGKTGSVLNETVYFNRSYKGYLSGVKVTGLPAGLKAEVHNQSVTIKGVPTAVANGTQATMTAKDEQGTAMTQKILFYIGSDTQIVTYVATENRTILANDDYSDSFRIYAYGGTGSKTYSLTGNTNKFISNSDYTINFASSVYNGTTNKYEKLPAAKYNVAYSVKDSANHTANGSVAVTAVNGVKITGNLKAADNTSLSSGSVSASFNDVNHVYADTYLYDSVASEDYTDNDNIKHTKGSYELVVYPGQVYDITATSGGAKTGLTNYNVASANKVQDFKLPLYKVTFASTAVDIKNISFDIDGVDGDGYKSYGVADTYLKKGTYVINREYSKTENNGFTTTNSSYKLSAVFTVNGNMTVNLTAAKVSSSTTNLIVGSLILDNEKYVSDYGYDDNDGYLSDVYYSFTPSEDGQYTITSDYDSLSGTIYTANAVKVDSFALSSGNDYQATVELKAGTQYVFQFSDSGYVTLSKYDPNAGNNASDEDE